MADATDDRTGSEAGNNGQSAEDQDIAKLIADAETSLQAQQDATAEGGEGEHKEADPYANLDLEKLPQDVKDRLEKPFKADYTRKMQDLAEQRKETQALQAKVLDSITQSLANRGVPQTQDELAAIKERIESGDLSGVVDLIKGEMNQRLAPVESKVALQSAIETAKNLEPLTVTYDKQIGQVLSQDKALMEMASVGGHRYAAFVFAGIAKDIELQRLRTEYDALKKGTEDRVRKAVTETLRRAKNLPPATSRAGTTATGTAGSEVTDIRQAMEAAAEESGLNQVLASRGH